MRFLLFSVLTVALAACSAPDRRAGAARDLEPAQARPARGLTFGDMDPHDWRRGRAPSNYAVHGIDVARYQGDVNWNRVRDAGIAFAYVKATEGGDYLDPKFRDNWRGAGRAGLRRGAYHYFYFCRPAEEQARWFIRHVPNDPNMLPPVLDMEWNHLSPTCTLRPAPEKVRSEARRFVRMIEAHYGKKPVIYTTPDFYDQTGIWRLGGVDFWLRSVAGHPYEVYPGGRWTFWQYTGTGIVPGVDGPVDINVFAGSEEAWRAWPG